MVRLASIIFENSEEQELVYNIPEELRKEMEYESHCATMQEETYCTGGMLLGIVIEREEKDPYVPRQMKVNISHQLGVIKKKIILLGSDFKEGSKEEATIKFLVFENEEGNEKEYFILPKKTKISFYKANNKELVQASGELFLKLISE